MRRLLSLATAFAALATTAFAPAPAHLTGGDVAGGGVNTVDRAIVVFEDGVDPVLTARRVLADVDAPTVHLYRHALAGVVVGTSAVDVAHLADDPAVAYVEADRPVRAAAQELPRGVRRVDAVAAASIGSGINRDVDIAVLDTGIGSHGDLRVVERLDCTNHDTSIVTRLEYALFGCEQGGKDNDGHGTRVAGVAAARDDGFGVVGVAPGARLWAIKVITSTSSGSLSDVIAGVDEVARLSDEIEVANLSLVADGRSQAMDDAIAGATDEGVVVVVAAGNASRNASQTTPANSPDAITVSAVTDLDGLPGGARSGSCNGRDDTFATYSNYGSVVDLAAPGSCIVTTDLGGGTASASGTSMAAPHVAGAAALRIAQRALGASSSRAATVLDDLRSTAAAENSACGYTGSPSNEPLLDLRRGC